MAETTLAELGVTPEVDVAKERKAHEFRAEKLASSPYMRSALMIIRDDEGVWGRVEPTPQEQELRERDVIVPGELHRVGTALFAKIYKNPDAAVLQDIAVFDTTQAESNFYREKIREGINYAPLIVVGAGGVYGTIFSAASLKENPNNPTFGLEAGKRRGGIWSTSGDVTLDKAWWRMNSRNRPEKRGVLPIPGTEANINTLGAEIQNLQIPDISAAQYPTNNELGRVLSHDNLLSNEMIVNAELVKVRPNRNSRQRGRYEQEYQDRRTGERFFVYSDIVVQATGLGQEDYGFNQQYPTTRKVIEEAREQRRRGVKTPRLLTFLQLVEETTSNKNIDPKEFEKLGIVGKGDTSRVIREYFAGIGGIEQELPAQLGFLKELVVYGLKEETAEELAKTERARYAAGLLEFQRKGREGGYFRFRPVEGRIEAVSIPRSGQGIGLYIKQEAEDAPKEGVTYEKNEIIPRLVAAAGFVDMTNRIYSGLTAEVIQDRKEIERRLDDALQKPGSTIFYKGGSEVSRIEIDRTDIDEATDGKIVTITLIDKAGKTRSIVVDRQNLSDDESLLFDPRQIVKLEIAGEPPRFKPYILEEYDSEIPVAEKAEGYEIYKIGAATSYPLTEKEKRRSEAYEAIPENTKSIFRYVRPVIAFARKITRETRPVKGAINLEEYRPQPVVLEKLGVTARRETSMVEVDPKAYAQRLSPNLRLDSLLKYLALSRLNAVFPEGLDEIRLGIRRVENPDGEVPFNLAVQFDPPLPDTVNWKIIDRFLQDSLTQRLLLRLTAKTPEAAEVSIGIKRRAVDVRNIQGRAIKKQEEVEFEEKYRRL